MTITKGFRPDPSPAATPVLKALIWLAQLIVAGVFITAGLAKLTMPIPDLSKMMAWTGQLPVVLVRCIGLLDITGAVGILLPAVVRVKPRLTVYAAAGCAALQVCAIAFHLLRGEVNLLPLNLVLLPLALLVWWGRGSKSPILPR